MFQINFKTFIWLLRKTETFGNQHSSAKIDKEIISMHSGQNCFTYFWEIDFTAVLFILRLEKPLERTYLEGIVWKFHWVTTTIIQDITFWNFEDFWRGTNFHLWIVWSHKGIVWKFAWFRTTNGWDITFRNYEDFWSKTYFHQWIVWSHKVIV